MAEQIQQKEELHRIFGGPVGGPKTARELWQQSGLDAHLCLHALKSDGSLARWAEYNPVYWLLWIMMAPAVALGYLFHVAIGQGGPVHEDESRREFESRVFWIYPTDGFLWVFILGALVIAVLELLEGDDTAAGSAAYAALVWSCFVLGNVFGMRFMAVKDAFCVKIFVVANLSFSFGLMVLLVVDVALYFTNSHLWDTLDFGQSAIETILFQLFVTLLYTVMAVSHARLFHIYDNPSEENDAKFALPGEPLGPAAAAANASTASMDSQLLGAQLLPGYEAAGGGGDGRRCCGWCRRRRRGFLHALAFLLCAAAILSLLLLGVVISARLLWDAL